MGVLSSYETVRGLLLTSNNQRPGALGGPTGNSTQSPTLQINAIPQQALSILFPY